MASCRRWASTHVQEPVPEGRARRGSCFRTCSRLWRSSFSQTAMKFKRSCPFPSACNSVMAQTAFDVSHFLLWVGDPWIWLDHLAIESRIGILNDGTRHLFLTSPSRTHLEGCGAQEATKTRGVQAGGIPSRQMLRSTAQKDVTS